MPKMHLSAQWPSMLNELNEQDAEQCFLNAATCMHFLRRIQEMMIRFVALVSQWV